MPVKKGRFTHSRVMKCANGNMKGQKSGARKVVMKTCWKGKKKKK